MLKLMRMGTINGSPDAPAMIEGGKIKAGTVLNHVNISVTTKIEEGVVMKEGIVLND